MLRVVYYLLMCNIVKTTENVKRFIEITKDAFQKMSKVLSNWKISLGRNESKSTPEKLHKTFSV